MVDLQSTPERPPSLPGPLSPGVWEFCCRYPLESLGCAEAQRPRGCAGLWGLGLPEMVRSEFNGSMKDPDDMTNFDGSLRSQWVVSVRRKILWPMES